MIPDYKLPIFNVNEDDLAREPFKKYGVTDKPQEDNLTHFARKIFNTEDGKRLLDELKKHFLLEPVAPIYQPIDYARYREGQNDIIRMFFKAAELKENE